jgi:hypothetical protein
MDFKMTKQGVRDLNVLSGQSRGRVLTMPPAGALLCHHPKRKLISHDDGATECGSCGQVWEKR